MLTKTLTHKTIKTDPESLIVNSQPAGIGRVSVLDSNLIINNLGRNFEICHPTDLTLRQLCRYAESAYPQDDEASQYDLDIHIFLHSQCKRFLLTLNHNGRLLFFNIEKLFKHSEQSPASVCKLPADSRTDLEPKAGAFWLSDVEHSLLIGDCLISSSPRGHHAVDSAQPGLFISQPLSMDKIQQDSVLNSSPKLAYRAFLTELGYISALDFNALSRMLAVGAGKSVALTSLRTKDNGVLSPTDLFWQSALAFQVTYLTFLDQDTILCAGPAPGSEWAAEWENLNGGGFAILEAGTGRILYSAPLDQDLAWGNGGQCIALSQDYQSFLGIDRHANLYKWNIDNHVSQVLFEHAQQSNSLGIAHMMSLNNKLYCGFNRDSYRLHVFDL